MVAAIDLHPNVPSNTVAYICDAALNLCKNYSNPTWNVT